MKFEEISMAEAMEVDGGQSVTVVLGPVVPILIAVEVTKKIISWIS